MLNSSQGAVAKLWWERARCPSVALLPLLMGFSGVRSPLKVFPLLSAYPFLPCALLTTIGSLSERGLVSVASLALVSLSMVVHAVA